MEAPLGHSRLSAEVWKEIFAHLPMWWRAMCCRVCKVWQKDLEQPQQGHGDEILVDYGLAALCSVLATEDVDEVMRRIRLHYPSGIPADLGRMDQVRRFVQRHRFAGIESVDEWMQLASQEPDAGWLCQAVSKTKLEGMGKSLMRQVVGKPQDFSKLLDTLRLSDDVSFVGYSPDGSTIACVCDNQTVRLWDTKTMEEKGTLWGHSEDNPECLCKHRDDDGRVFISTIDVNPECPVKGHSGRVNGVAYSPDGKRIATFADFTVKIWDAVTLVEVYSFTGHSGYVKSVMWSPDGEIILSRVADAAEAVCLWSESGKLKGTLKGHSRYNPECACRHSQTEYGTWKVDVNAECPVTGHTGQVLDVALSPNSKHIATASTNQTITIWDAETKQEVCSLTGHSKRISSVAWSPDGEMLASGSWDQTVRLYSKLGEHKGTLVGFSGSVDSVAWSPDSEMIASGTRNTTVQLWSKSGELKGNLKGHKSEVKCVAYSPDGTRVASASKDKTVKIWDCSDAGTKQGMRLLKRPSSYVWCVTYSPDGTRIASASEDKTVKIWDAVTMQELGSLRGHSKMVTCVAYAPDGNRIASASNDSTVKIWDPVTMEVVCSLTGHSGGVNHVAWSPDGEFIASASDDETIRLWSKSGDHKGTLTGHSDNVSSVAYSPDGSTIASGSWDKTVRLWNTQTMKQKVTLRGHARDNAACNCQHYMRDSAWLASGHSFCRVRGHSKEVTNVSWSLKVEFRECIASASDDETVFLWSKSGEIEANMLGHDEDNRNCLCRYDEDYRYDRRWSPFHRKTWCPVRGRIPPWPHLDPETKFNATKNGESAASNRTGQYIVTAYDDMVLVYRTDSDGEEHGEPLACFRSPARVRTVSCKGTSVVVGCEDKQVSCFLPCGANAAVF